MKSEDKFYCPNCKHLYEDIQNYGLENPDEEGLFDMKCESCEVEFEVNFKTVIYFETK